MSKAIIGKGGCAALALALAAVSFTASATTNAGGSTEARSVPTRGMTMAHVRTLYGQPTARKPAVGNPPITRWKYAHFTVYFEYNRVIDSVIPGNPPPIYHRSQLEQRSVKTSSR